MTFDKKFIPLILKGEKFLTLRTSSHHKDKFQVDGVDFIALCIANFTVSDFLRAFYSESFDPEDFGFSHSVEASNYYLDYLTSKKLSLSDFVFVHLIYCYQFPCFVGDKDGVK